MSRSRYSVRLTEAADRDVNDILDHAVQTLGPIDAAKLIEQLLDKVASLAEFPDQRVAIH